MEIRRRLDQDDLLFLTQDTEFIMAPMPAAAWIIVSRVKQSRPVQERVEVWLRAIRSVFSKTPPSRILELMDGRTTAALVRWNGPHRLILDRASARPN